jgi:SAM-dependent methyltransferase
MVGHNLTALLKTYERHPLSEAALVRRLAGREAPITEFDLAIDREHELTDQNHIGGFESTIALAESAQVSRNDTVIDLGCGLGGPARVLAVVYACHVHGVDANADRIRQARSLSALVGLESQVSFETGDIRTYSCDRRFTVLWAQNAWIHFVEPDLFQIIAVSLLRPGPGVRIAFEDVCLVRECASQQERDGIARLNEVWHCHLRLPRLWAEGIKEAGFEIIVIEDLSSLMISYLERISRLTRFSQDVVPPHEALGWSLGQELARQGVISYVRIVGVRKCSNT